MKAELADFLFFNTMGTKKNTKLTRKAAGFWHLAPSNIGKVPTYLFYAADVERLACGGLV